MTTGAAPEAPHSHLMADWRPSFPLHQIPWIGSKRRQAGVRIANRAELIGPVQTGGFSLQLGVTVQRHRKSLSAK